MIEAEDVLKPSVHSHGAQHSPAESVEECRADQIPHCSPRHRPGDAERCIGKRSARTEKAEREQKQIDGEGKDGRFNKWNDE